MIASKAADHVGQPKLRHGEFEPTAAQDAEVTVSYPGRSTQQSSKIGLTQNHGAGTASIGKQFQFMHRVVGSGKTQANPATRRRAFVQITLFRWRRRWHEPK